MPNSLRAVASPAVRQLASEVATLDPSIAGDAGIASLAHRLRRAMSRASGMTSPFAEVPTRTRADRRDMAVLRRLYRRVEAACVRNAPRPAL